MKLDNKTLLGAYLIYKAGQHSVKVEAPEPAPKEEKAVTTGKEEPDPIVDGIWRMLKIVACVMAFVLGIILYRAIFM